MKKLTPEMVIARTKISDLSKVKRLNCWGSELVDVTLLREMPSVEVLSLSINKINTLADFEKCRALQELYIRQNEIQDLNQVCYLQGLTELKHLWLGENPCAANDGYRLAVLRILPHLQKLDNVAVLPEEVKEAAKKGRPLAHPEDTANDDDDYQQPQMQQQQQQYQRYTQDQSPEYSPRQSPSRVEMPSPKRQEAPRRSYSPEVPEYQDRRATSNSYDRDSPKQQQFYEQNTSYEECGQSENGRETMMRIVTSQSVNNIKDYANGDRYSNSSQQQWRHSENNEIPYHSNESVQGSQRREPRYTCQATTHRPPFNRRPVTRNSNILSAVLCLVKELDYPSLEVVEMAVRCRMDELED